MTTVGITMSLSRLKDVRTVVDCRNGMYVVYCAVCDRSLYLSEEELRSFEHSDEFCTAHVKECFNRNRVSPAVLRSKIAKVGYDFALEYYSADYVHGQASIISKLPDVEYMEMLCNRRFVRIICRVCHKSVLLPTRDAVSFKHSDKCELNRWDI